MSPASGRILTKDTAWRFLVWKYLGFPVTGTKNGAHPPSGSGQLPRRPLGSGPCAGAHRPYPGIVRLLSAATLAGVVLVSAAACTREPGFEDRTARVTVDGETTTFQVDGCGLDGTTVFVLGRTDDGDVLQAVVGVEADGATGVPASTGLTVTEADVPVAAFGAESWARRSEEGPPPGDITSARVQGARIQAAGDAQPLDINEQPTSADPVPFSFDARCDQRDDG